VTALRSILRATPFHVRAAAANRDNAWTTRNGVTLCHHYEDAALESLSGRMNVVLADISWRWRVRIEGPGAETYLSRLVTHDVTALEPGRGTKALWLTDGGGVRGAGVVVRLGRDSFQVTASAPDEEWFAQAASSFDVTLRDLWTDAGGLALVGPYAQSTLEAAGFGLRLEPLACQRITWQGIEVMVSRWGEHDGYEIWCDPDDGLMVWDQLIRAGRAFGIEPAGVMAMDVLDLEAGIPRPFLDFLPARDGTTGEPAASALGLDSLIDPAHLRFNGRAAHLDLKPVRKLVGIEISSRQPAPFTPVSLNHAAAEAGPRWAFPPQPASFTPVMLNDKSVGHTLRSVYSPALRRAIALASVDAEAAAPGTMLSLFLPPDLNTPDLRRAEARVAALPFLAPPEEAGH
jgi:aminomethyltransferase